MRKRRNIKKYPNIYGNEESVMLKTKKVLAFLLASAMVCVGFTGCGEDDAKESSSSSSESSESSEESSSEDSSESSEGESSEGGEPAGGQMVVAGDIEDAVVAESGDAYLAIVDGQWYVQYWGSDEDLLTYDAGVVPITGDGEYTVSVNGASKGMRYDVTGDTEDPYKPSGMSFMAVMVKDGMTKFPNMAIEVTSIKKDGEEVPMSAKNFTSSDDQVEMRANIYNEWVTTLPEDAHDANGPVTDANTYSAQIVDPSVFNSEWESIEVTFNVTGIDAAQ